MKVYRLRHARFDHRPGELAYSFHGPDYGCVLDDEEDTGAPHLILTSNPDGSGPFWTCPAASVDVVRP